MSRDWEAEVEDDLFQAEDDLFRKAMEALERAPDKDVSTSASKPVQTRRRRRGRREPDAKLDLHGRKADEARHALTHFVQRCQRRGWRRVLVITGKGRRSPGGVSVLKGELERWIRGRGAEYVESWAPAPRDQGGDGAYLLELRSSRN